MAQIQPLPKVREGYNSYLVAGQHFHVPDNFVVTKAIGQGAYGVVCAARNVRTGQPVAIKKICKVFECLTDAVRTLREIKLLHHFRHENIVGLEDIIKPLDYTALDDVYIINDLMDTDLHQIISSPQPLTDDHIQYFVYQILRGLKYIHSGNVLHRDLKPSNLLVNGNCDLKICDFGLARVNDAGMGHDQFMTQYVATRWYRAPEVILSWKRYTEAIDVWAVGCIFAELLRRKPLFPGRDYINQIELITEMLGTPTAEDIADIKSEKARRYLTSLPFKPRVNFRAFFPSECNPLALDLLDKMLQINPDKRITTTDALAHPYLASLHEPADEPTCTQPFDFEWERAPLSKALVKSLIFKEIVSFHPELFYEMDNPLANPNHPDHISIRQAYLQAGVAVEAGGLGIFAQPSITPGLEAQLSPAVLDLQRMNQDLILQQLQAEQEQFLLQQQAQQSVPFMMQQLTPPPQEPQDLDAQLQFIAMMTMRQQQQQQRDAAGQPAALQQYASAPSLPVIGSTPGFPGAGLRNAPGSLPPRPFSLNQSHPAVFATNSAAAILGGPGGLGIGPGLYGQQQQQQQAQAQQQMQSSAMSTDPLSAIDLSTLTPEDFAQLEFMIASKSSSTGPFPNL